MTQNSPTPVTALGFTQEFKDYQNVGLPLNKALNLKIDPLYETADMKQAREHMLRIARTISSDTLSLNQVEKRLKNWVQLFWNIP
jgi:hypothetical protein